MIFEVKEKPYKTVLFWLNKSETKDENLITSLKPVFNNWTNKKYRCVVFKSGTGNNMDDSLHMLMKRHYYELAKELHEKDIAR